MIHRTALIADDDAGLCKVLTVRCKSLGFDVLTAHDAMHALVVAHRHEPEVIIMDINMPAGNGLSACEMLATDPRFAISVLIVLSGTENEMHKLRAESFGALFVPKDGDYWPTIRAHLLNIFKIPPHKHDRAAA